MSELFKSRVQNAHHEYTYTAMAIFRACQYGNLKSLKELVVAGADVNGRSPSDRATPLIFAAKYGHASLIDFLIRMRAQVNYVDDMGRTALMVACIMGEWKCVRALLFSWQADIDKVDNSGNSALILTASHISIESHLTCMRLLLEQDADVNLKNKIGMTATMYTANNVTIGWEGVKMLLNAGADPEALNNVRENLLMQAASQGHEEILQWLMDVGINDIKQTNSFGDNALILALKTGNATCVKKLLHAGSDPNSFSGQGSHALSIAASVSFENTLLLLKYGAVPQPSRLFVCHELLADQCDEVRTACMNCSQWFQPTDIAVLHQKFSVANLLSTVTSCHPSYRLSSTASSKDLNPFTKTVLDFIDSAAVSCRVWLKMSREFSSGPSTLLFLCQQVVSSMAGLSKRRLERLNSYGLPPKLVRNILLEGLTEDMFLLLDEDEV